MKSRTGLPGRHGFELDLERRDRERGELRGIVLLDLCEHRWDLNGRLTDIFLDRERFFPLRLFVSGTSPPFAGGASSTATSS